MENTYTKEEMDLMFAQHPELLEYAAELLMPKFFTVEYMWTMYKIHPEILEWAREVFKSEEKKKRQYRKSEIEKAREKREALPPEEKIKLLNTPWEKIPEELRAGMTKNPMHFNFVRMDRPNIGPQQETCGARVVRFRNDHEMSREDFANYCNVWAKQYDIDGPRGHQSTRLKTSDILHYEDMNVSPKTDKLWAMTRALGMPMPYFTGYGSTDGVMSSNETIRSRFRKKRAN